MSHLNENPSEVSNIAKIPWCTHIVSSTVIEYTNKFFAIGHESCDMHTKYLSHLPLAHCHLYSQRRI